AMRHPPLIHVLRALPKPFAVILGGIPVQGHESVAGFARGNTPLHWQFRVYTHCRDKKGVIACATIKRDSWESATICETWPNREALRPRLNRFRDRPLEETLDLEQSIILEAMRTRPVRREPVLRNADRRHGMKMAVLMAAALILAPLPTRSQEAQPTESREPS